MNAKTIYVSATSTVLNVSMFGRSAFRPTGVLSVLLLIAGAVGGLPAHAQQQEVPDAVQEELEARDLTPAEARRRAQQLGIDLSNPQQAIQQARRRGVPEARIQALLKAARARQGGGQLPAVQQPSAGPRLSGQATVQPDSVLLFDLPVTTSVQIPLTSDTTITSVAPFLVGNDQPTRDTIRAEGVRLDRRTDAGSVWTGEIPVPAELSAGRYPLKVRVSTEAGTAVLSTSEFLVLRSDSVGERKREKAARDTLQYFGYETFETVPNAFQPSPTGPVDDNYVVGPGDELRLLVWGAPEFQYDLTVDQQGRVYVPNHGQFTVVGKELSTLRKDMKKWLARQHSGLTADPQTVFMDLSVTRIQPIKVYVLGEVSRPGGYTVSAMSNAFNALYSVGGPLQRGSLRRVQVIRNGELVAKVDLYDYLAESNSPDPVGLQNGDYLRVPVRGKTVAITGAVERPAYYELKEGETVKDLIEYAGGVEPDAYTASFRISRLVPPEERTSENPSVPRKEMTFNLGEVLAGNRSVSLEDADRVRIRSIPPASDPAATSNVKSARISGAVFQPGEYTIADSVQTVSGLIEEANGLTDDAYRRQATLVRINKDLGQAVRTINVDSAMAGVPRADIPLVPGDSLHISSVQKLEGRRTVRITGKVRNPGTYPYRTGMTVADLLFQGGGLADSTYLRDVLRSRADLYREAKSGRSEQIIPFNLSRALNGSGKAEMPLRPGDEIRVYPLRAEVNQDKFVEISGAVKNPGQYDFQKNLTMKDLILRANGFQEDVYLKEIQVARPKEDSEGMRTIRVPLDVTAAEGDSIRYVAEGDTAQVLRAAAEFQLQHRDRVLVRTDPAYSERSFVSVQGEVQFPGDYALKEDGERLSSVLERAGGITAQGYPGGGRLLRDGERFVIDIARVAQGQEDLALMPGDRIVIPTDPNSVSVRGNVARPGLIKHEPGADVEYYLDRAGGTRDSTQTVLLTQANGATFKVGTGLFSGSTKVTDGAVIRVTREPPPPPNQEGVDIGQVITDVTGILSSALTIIVLATRAFGN